MPITSKFFVRSTIALLSVGLLALLVIVGTTLWLSERSQSYFNDVIDARNTRAAVVDLRNALLTAESSQRGFLLTDDPSYLAPYQGAIDRIAEQYLAVVATLGTDASVADGVAQLKRAIDAKLSEMDHTIDLTKAGQTAEALAIVNTDAGKALMDEAQRFFTAMIEGADQRLTAGVMEQRANAIWLRWASLIGAVVIVAMVGGSAITVLRYTRELAEARDEVTTLNAGLEQRVAERTADLARANDEIQRFAYIVTHDLRAPLVNIMGFTSELETSVASVQALIEKSDPGNDPVAAEARLAATEDLPEAISFIRSSTKKMDGLINAILKISREGRRALKPERIDLGEVLKTATAAIQHQVGEADGEVTLQLGAPAIRSDRMSLEQIFGNLLDNAVKYRAKERPLRLAIVTSVAPGNRVTVEVSDNGRGIAEQDRERVFELFRRSGVQDQAGEGIGLAHVRTVVRNLGGDITLRSVLNEGTTFTVTLPRNLQLPGSNNA